MHNGLFNFLYIVWGNVKSTLNVKKISIKRRRVNILQKRGLFMCLSHYNEDTCCILFRLELECTNIMYWRSFYCQTFFLVHHFIFNMSNTISCLLLSTAQKFAMQKSWGWPSLFYDFGEVSINHFMIFIVADVMAVFPNAH